MNDILMFKDTPGLGDVVKNSKAFCKLTKNMQNISYQYIIGDFNNPNMHGLAGHKFSRLCGFTFTSAINTDFPTFQLVYVPKLRATLTRNDKALSGWYCWKVINNINRQVISLADMKKLYKFDVTAFFHSDLFEKYLPLFKSNINYVLQHQIKDLIGSIKNSQELKQLKFYVNAIAESIKEIDNVQTYVIYDNTEKLRTTSDNPDAVANIAYNANKSYNLKDIDKNSPKVKDTRPQNIKQTHNSSQKSSVKLIPAQDLKNKFIAKAKLSDDQIFDKYDDYENDDYK